MVDLTDQKTLEKVLEEKKMYLESLQQKLLEYENRLKELLGNSLSYNKVKLKKEDLEYEIWKYKTKIASLIDLRKSTFDDASTDISESSKYYNLCEAYFDSLPETPKPKEYTDYLTARDKVKKFYYVPIFFPRKSKHFRLTSITEFKIGGVSCVTTVLLITLLRSLFPAMFNDFMSVFITCFPIYFSIEFATSTLLNKIIVKPFLRKEENWKTYADDNNVLQHLSEKVIENINKQIVEVQEKCDEVNAVLGNYIVENSETLKYSSRINYCKSLISSLTKEIESEKKDILALQSTLSAYDSNSQDELEREPVLVKKIKE